LSSLKVAVIRVHEIRIGKGKNQIVQNPGPFVGIFFLSTTSQASPSTYRAWVIDEAQITKVFQRKSTPIAAIKKRGTSPGSPILGGKPSKSLEGNTIGNISAPNLDYELFVIVDPA